MNLAELLQPWGITKVPNLSVLGLCNDSRVIKPGEVFVAYLGEAFDGRLFLEQAQKAGALAAIYDPDALPDSFRCPEGMLCIPVPGLKKNLAAIACHFYGNPSQELSITGVTGTNGKTTVAYQLAQAHGYLGHRAAYLGTLGQGEVRSLEPMANTTPDALCLQRYLHTYQHNQIRQVCMEVSSHALSQGRVANVAFEQAIYTNLSHEHLDFHHTMEAYARAKALLFEFPNLKWAIVNGDDPYHEAMLKARSASCQVLTYGLQEGCDVRAINPELSISDATFEVISPWGQHRLHSNGLGLFNVYNSLAVFTSLMTCGYAVKNVIDVIARLKTSPGRMEVVAKQPYVIVDFAHTPAALENALSTLVNVKQGRLFVVFGCGGDRDTTKRPIMGKIANQYSDVVILTSDNPRTENPEQIIEEIAQGFPMTDKVFKTPDRRQAIQQALRMLEPNDIVLIAGKGHEAYQLIGTERFPFSDQAVVRGELSALRTQCE